MIKYESNTLYGLLLRIKDKEDSVWLQKAGYMINIYHGLSYTLDLPVEILIETY